MNRRVVTYGPEIRRTDLGDTVTTRFAVYPSGNLVEHITVEVLPPKDHNKPGRTWPAQAADDVWSRVKPVSGDTVLC